MSYNLIDKHNTLYPEFQCSNYLYFNGEPYAYWLECSAYKVYEWVLFKEYNDYESVCRPNDCIAAINYDKLIESFKTSSFYENMDREEMCRTFRQRSLKTEFGPDSESYWDFEDFIDEEYEKWLKENNKK